MTIRDHKYNELYKTKQQLIQELQTLSKKEGKEQEQEYLKKQLIQTEKKLNDYLERKEKNYPNCVLCSQKVHPSCLMIAGRPRNYHNECWVKEEEEIKKEKISSPYLFAKVEELEKEIREMKNNSRR